MLPPPPSSTPFPYPPPFRSPEALPVEPVAEIDASRQAAGYRPHCVVLPSSESGEHQRVPIRRKCTRELEPALTGPLLHGRDRKSTRLNSSHANIAYAVLCSK